jgi:fatty acid desaturase
MATSAGDGTTVEEGSGRNRKRAAKAVLPFLAIGLADVLLLLFWGIEPLWGFAILPPILFITVLAWIAFSTDFLEDRT